MRLGKRSLALIQHNAAPFGLGLILGSVWTYYNIADPNRADDPQAESNFFCIRKQVGTVPQPRKKDWVATAYRVNCDVISSNEFVYVYLLRAGQTTSRSTLVISYVGGDPALRWRDEDALVVRAEDVDEIIRQTVEVVGVKVSYELMRRGAN